MAGRLVTIATFDLPAKARVAQNVLGDAGIKAVVTDEETVAMDWLLGNAVGWVKVQVLEEDAERAVAALEESLGVGGEPVDEEALAAAAEAAPVDEGEERPEPSPEPDEPTTPPRSAAEPLPPADESDSQRSERDEYAHRFILAAFFGLVVPLLWFYAMYLFLNAAFGEGRLSPASRRKLLAGGLLLVLGTVTAYFLIRYYGDPFP